MAVSREARIGEEAAEMENAFGQAVKMAIAYKQEENLPVARFDVDAQRPYLEYGDGRREYTLEA